MFALLLLYCVLIDAQNSTISIADLTSPIPPFGNIVNLIPFSAETDSQIVVDLIKAGSDEIYGTGQRSVRAGSGDTRVTLVVNGIILEAGSFSLRVYILPEQFSTAASPIDVATDVQYFPVQISNVTAFQVYTITLLLNFTGTCNDFESRLEDSFEELHPEIVGDISYTARSLACEALDPPHSQILIKIYLGGGNLTTRIDTLFSMYQSFSSLSYIDAISQNVSTDLTQDSIVVSGYDYDLDLRLITFWQVFGTILAVIGWIIIWSIIISIVYAIMTEGSALAGEFEHV